MQSANLVEMRDVKSNFNLLTHRQHNNRCIEVFREIYKIIFNLKKKRTEAGTQKVAKRIPSIIGKVVSETRDKLI